ncbi:MAG: carbamoyltransferase HypF, partial [Coriobacteriales bacterium]|nr:carbamoyltransferase HypF [Coriobacteriales bacterium]
MPASRDLHISGIVQGVGFRPFVYRLALSHGLNGWVLNAGDGVRIHIEGDTTALDTFVEDLPRQAPSAARIIALESHEGSFEGLAGFSIRESAAGGSLSTLVSPDIATCPDCLRELFDAGDRRFHYPFINCTNCGPRFTIIGALPYDRPATSMAPFTMCARCDAEYHDPFDRRFHAQPDACFACGPTLRLWRPGEVEVGVGAGALAGGEALASDEVPPVHKPRTSKDTGIRTASNREASDALITETAALLAEGAIVAIKGIGGYHLACDATNEATVALLRKRKRRPAKPFALMVQSLEEARRLCYLCDEEAALLSGTVRPIVLLMRRASATDIAPSVAANLHELGIMLPSTPLQHLLMAAVAVPLVMTSGNISEEPIIAQEQEALDMLSGVADAFLDNDRAILSRYDDSVVRVVNGHAQMIRRARGYAPRPLRFAWPSATVAPSPTPSIPAPPTAPAPPPSPHRPNILAVGPEQKNTFCLVRGEEAFCSQHLGDLESASSFEAWLSTLALYRRLFGLDYQVLACDTHPEYLSTKWARAQGEARLEAQHHHAHIASVLAEHRSKGALELAPQTAQLTPSPAGDMGLVERVIGIAFDGSGFGTDGSIWGGEALIASLEDFERFAHLRPVPLPGGRGAIDNPARMAWAYLRFLGLTEHRGAAPLAATLGTDRVLLLNQMMAARINTPTTSSIGRLFDAVSALAGIRATSSYEGQAAIELEAALYNAATGAPIVDPDPQAAAERYRFALGRVDTQDEGRGDEGNKWG